MGHAYLDVWTAHDRLIDAALMASARGVDVLVVIHGYGSTGTGGVIPPEDYAELTGAGVAAVFGPGTNLIEAASALLRLLSD